MRALFVFVVFGCFGLACDDKGAAPAQEAAPVEAKPAPAKAPAPEPKKEEPPKPTYLAKVEALEGKPVIVRAGEEKPAEVGFEVLAADVVKTPAKSKIRLAFTDKTVVSLGDKSEMTVGGLEADEAKGRKGTLALAAGRFWMNVEKWAGQGESLWEVATPNAVAGVRGTTLWGDVKVDAICALDGTVEVRSTKNEKLKPMTCNAGTCASKLSKGKLAPMKPKPKQVQGFLKQVTIASAEPKAEDKAAAEAKPLPKKK
jgi:hypothetical protein